MVELSGEKVAKERVKMSPTSRLAPWEEQLPECICKETAVRSEGRA